MITHSVKDIHAVTPWLENLPFDWSPVIEKATKKKFKKHKVVFDQNEQADHLYVVTSGRVRLYLISPNGDEKALAIIGKNGLVGECGFYDEGVYSTSAITASEATLYQIHKEEFRNLLKQHFNLVEQAMFLSTRKYKLLCMQTLQLSYSKAMPRICASLIQLALNYGTTLDNQEIQISITFTHQELANLIGTTRVTVVKTLRLLEDEHILLKRNRYYVIKDLEKLTELAHIE